MLLMVLTLSLLITVVQQLGVFGMFSMERPKPMSSMLTAMQLHTFDIEILKMNCVAVATPFFCLSV